MAYSYNDYVSGTNSDGTSYTVTTSTVFASPPYLSGRGASDVTVTVDGVIKVKDTDYTITNTEVKFLFAKIPPAGAKIRISRNSSQGQRITDYSDASLLNADTMDADANQLFFIAQEAIDTASETNLAVSTFYSSGTSTPSSASAGDLFFNTATGLLQIYTGSAWESVNNRGTKQTFTISGSTTVFTPSTPVDDNTLVFLNGVLLVKGAGSAGDYTTSSTQVTLNTAVSSGVVEIVTFPNATNGTFTSGINVTGTITADSLTMGDSEKIILGAGGDLEIFHQASANESGYTHSSHIQEKGDGQLFIDANHFAVRTGDANPEGNDSTPTDYNRILSTGAAAGGTVFCSGVESPTSSDPSFQNRRMYIKPTVDGSYRGGVDVYGDMRLLREDYAGTGIGGGRLEATSIKGITGGGIATALSIETAIDVTGTVTADGLTLGDSEYIKIGAGNDAGIPDLQIFSGGGNAFIEQPSGSGNNTNLIIRGQTINLRNDADATLISTDNDQVRMWTQVVGSEDSTNGAAKFSTTTAGIDVNGTVTASSDIEVTDNTKGVILKSPNGSRFRLEVANDGTLSTEAL